MTKTRRVLVIMRAKKYCYTAKDIAEMVGWSRREVYRAIEKGLFRPDDFCNTYSFITSVRLTNEMAGGGPLGMGANHEK